MDGLPAEAPSAEAGAFQSGLGNGRGRGTEFVLAHPLPAAADAIIIIKGSATGARMSIPGKYRTVPAKSTVL